MAPKTAVKAEPTHRCAAVACREQVPLRRLFCDDHWTLVPRWLQDQLREHFRYGQETGKVPVSPVWLDLADKAIAEIVEREAAA